MNLFFNIFIFFLYLIIFTGTQIYESKELTDVFVPNSVTSIGYFAFSGCTNLSNIIISSSNTVISGTAFDEIDDLTIKYLDTGKEEKKTALKKCNNTTIAPGTTVISSDTYSGCNNITNITIPASVTSIELGAFENCKNLRSVTFENGSQLEEISDVAFRGSGITNITIPSSVTRIGAEAFANCKNLKSVTFENGSQLEEISDVAFRGSGLESITIPATVTEIGYGAFNNCRNLASINVESENTVYEDRGSNAIIEKESNKLIVGSKNTVIPNSVTSIGYEAFRGSGITSITIPSNVTTIEESAFIEASNLKKVVIQHDSSHSLNIEPLAFYKCKNLDKVEFTTANKKAAISLNSAFLFLLDLSDDDTFKKFPMYLRWRYVKNGILLF